MVEYSTKPIMRLGMNCYEAACLDKAHPLVNEDVLMGSILKY